MTEKMIGNYGFMPLPGTFLQSKPFSVELKTWPADSIFHAGNGYSAPPSAMKNPLI